MAVFAFIVNHRRPRAGVLVSEAAQRLTDLGHQVRLPRDDADALALAAPPLAALGRDGPELVAGVDLAVSFGGDGTVLRAVHLVARQGVAVLGVNLGRLGYLASVEPSGLGEALERYLSGHYAIEERMMLTVALERRASAQEEPSELWALNEAVLERPSPGHTVHVTVSVDGRPWTTYAADGLIVASPTGSTAYAFSARGPILSPGLRAMLMTPVSPHMPFDRSLVFDPSQTVRIELSDDRPAVLVIDGRQVAVLGWGDAIVCSAAPRPARFVTFGARDFYGVLKAKFGVADR